MAALFHTQFSGVTAPHRPIEGRATVSLTIYDKYCAGAFDRVFRRFIYVFIDLL